MKKNIVSGNNKIIKQLRRLNTKKYRDQESLFVAEGIKIVKEAILYTDVAYIIIDKRLDGYDLGIDFGGIECYCCSTEIFRKISNTISSQGIIAVCRKPVDRYNVKNFSSTVLILDKISDPGNMGTILRSAEAFGVKSIVVTSQCIEIYNPKVVRSSMGSIFRLDVYGDTVIERLKQEGYYFISTATENSDRKGKNIYTFPFPNEKIAVILGNESSGVSEEFYSLADSNVFIPMCSPVESLNVAVAASVILSEINRRVL